MVKTEAMESLSKAAKEVGCYNSFFYHIHLFGCKYVKSFKGSLTRVLTFFGWVLNTSPILYNVIYGGLLLAISNFKLEQKDCLMVRILSDCLVDYYIFHSFKVQFAKLSSKSA